MLNLSISVKDNNPNHHLYLNNGTWFIHFTIHKDDYTSQRTRKSLKTKDIKMARRKRDNFFKYHIENNKRLQNV